MEVDLHNRLNTIEAKIDLVLEKLRPELFEKEKKDEVNK